MHSSAGFLPMLAVWRRLRMGMQLPASPLKPNAPALRVVDSCFAITSKTVFWNN